jgi:hypothetical protein
MIYCLYSTGGKLHKLHVPFFRRQVRQSRVFKHQVKRTVATLLTARENAASASRTTLARHFGHICQTDFDNEHLLYYYVLLIYSKMF